MSRQVALVTGARGEMGSLLVPALASRGWSVVALDLEPLPEGFDSHCAATVQADLLDRPLLEKLFERWSPQRVFHLAALLSSSAEKKPDLAHRVNVEGTYGLLGLCMQHGPCRVLYPSSIAVYGLPDLATKTETGAVREHEWVLPTSMYGGNKVYCEFLGTYFSKREPQLDFRSIRFPGLISAETLPSGGTTDYAPEMIHAGARGRPYRCFVREDTRLPFMTMQDAVEAVLRLAEAEPSALSTRVYNIQGFSASAGEIRDETLRHFPEASIGFEPAPGRQAIVDTWPAAVDDRRARKDWGLDPRHDLAAALESYLVPALRRRYPGTIQVEN